MIKRDQLISFVFVFFAVCLAGILVNNQFFLKTTTKNFLISTGVALVILSPSVAFSFTPRPHSAHFGYVLALATLLFFLKVFGNGEGNGGASFLIIPTVVGGFFFCLIGVGIGWLSLKPSSEVAQVKIKT